MTQDKRFRNNNTRRVHPTWAATSHIWRPSPPDQVRAVGVPVLTILWVLTINKRAQKKKKQPSSSSVFALCSHFLGLWAGFSTYKINSSPLLEHKQISILNNKQTNRERPEMSNIRLCYVYIIASTHLLFQEEASQHFLGNESAAIKSFCFLQWYLEFSSKAFVSKDVFNPIRNICAVRFFSLIQKSVINTQNLRHNLQSRSLFSIAFSSFASYRSESCGISLWLSIVLSPKECHQHNNSISKGIDTSCWTEYHQHNNSISVELDNNKGIDTSCWTSEQMQNIP